MDINRRKALQIYFTRRVGSMEFQKKSLECQFPLFGRFIEIQGVNPTIELLFRYIFDDVIRWKYDVICKIFFIFLFSLQVEVWFSPVSVLIVCKSTLLHSYAPSCTNHVIQVMPEELNYIVGNIYKINNKQNNSVYQGLRVIPMHISDNLRNSAFIAFESHWINCGKNDFCCFTRKLA